jgi:hypothetical protein
MNGIGTIVKNGTLIVFSVRTPVVEFVTLYENFTLIALRFASKPTALMNCTVEMAAAACALMIAVSGPAQSQQQAISSVQHITDIHVPIVRLTHRQSCQRSRWRTARLLSPARQAVTRTMSALANS